jgi:two-component system phosphate regulon sensor histidine kinase PhoR
MTTGTEKILLLISDPLLAQRIEFAVGLDGVAIQIIQTGAEIQPAFSFESPSLVLVAASFEKNRGWDVAEGLLHKYPAFPVVLLVEDVECSIYQKAMNLGLRAIIPLSIDDAAIKKMVESILNTCSRQREWFLRQERANTASLRQKLNELTMLSELGRSINISLEQDRVLLAVVDAAVQLTGAEEGSLMLLDETSGELYIRAARNLNDEQIKTMRLPVSDSLAGEVVKSGKPVLLEKDNPQKIKTSYFVHSLVYVPLIGKDRVIGVLGVDHRQRARYFSQRDLQLLMVLAEYAVIAMRNVWSYAEALEQSGRLENILSRIQDGVIVLDDEKKLRFINQAARRVFSLEAKEVQGKPVDQEIASEELHNLLENAVEYPDMWVELEAADGQEYRAQAAEVPGVGTAVTLTDITYLKRLDRIKNEFVSTVSHDLRSPLTSIMGYVDLIGRVGPVNDMQRQFMGKVQDSVRNITNLVDDLLTLGRVEAGLDTRREAVTLPDLIQQAWTDLKTPVDKSLFQLIVDIPAELQPLQVNPVQFKSMVQNLLDNALRYSQPGGEIKVLGSQEDGSVVLRFIDQGVGILPQDLPYVFNKFYRGSNVASEISGTGLGLSIAKSVIENHEGRIWVESQPGQGTVVSVMFPLSRKH